MVTRWPFVGRYAEVSRVEALLGDGVGALLVGEPGVGKTALARHIAARAGRAGTPVTTFAGHAATGGEVPYEPFATVLGGVDGRPPPAVEVAARVRDALPAGNVLLVVDDVHLFGEASARVVGHLAADAHIGLVMTAIGERPVPLAVDRLWRDGTCQRVDVRGMPVEDVGAALEAALGGPVDPRTTRLFAGRTEGNALLLRELTLAAVTGGALTRRDGVWSLTGEPPLSDGLRALVATRFASVDPALLVALETVAAGEPLDARVALAAVGAERLEELETARLLVVRDGLGTSDVGTAHPIYGEVLRAGMPKLRLRRLRLDLARTIEKSPAASDRDLVRAALWRVDAGQVGDLDQLIRAARAARVFSLDTAEHLARAAHEASASVDAALLLAEVYTLTGRPADAARLTAALPPDSLSAADRDAIVYTAAMGQGLPGGDLAGAADLVAGAVAGAPEASKMLRALHASLLALDAHPAPAFEVGAPLVHDTTADPATRTLAAIAVVGAAFWLGRTREADRIGAALLPVTDSVRPAMPFGTPSLRLMMICGAIEEGRLDDAEREALAMREVAAATDDEWAEPRAGYCLGRVALLHGQAGTARRYFQRCLGTMTPFDRSFVRHLSSCLARAASAGGDVATATAALAVPADTPKITAYELEFDLAEAALLAARLRLPEAAERAAWVASAAAARQQWNVAVTACHDAARYGGATYVVGAARDAAARVDGTFGGVALGHVTALAGRDPAALARSSDAFESLGMVQYAAEAAAEAAIGYASRGDGRSARACGQRFARLRDECEDVAFPWLAAVTAAAPLTVRERQVARLAAAGGSDADIASQLGISLRTVQTHLTRVYDKLGVRRRGDLATHLD